MNWRTELLTSSTSPKGRTSQDLVEFLRDAKPAERKIWLATLTSKEKQTVLQVLEQLNANPWSQYANDPVGFIERGLGEQIWSKQREILESVRDNKRTAVPACHAPGKSHLAARMVAWWVMSQPKGTSQVVTTATSFRQVRNILWSHIRKLHAVHNLDGEALTVEWKIDGIQAAFGFAPAQYNETALQGIHAPNLLVVVDEAGGVQDTIGTALEALMTGGNTKLLLLGNPPTDNENSWFERACNSPLYNTIPISAFDTPNFTGEDVGNCKTCPPSVGTHSLASHLVDETWVNDVISELGETSAFVKARVHAEFPKVTGNRVIPSTWIDDATNNLNPAPGQQIRLGIDIAADGGDEFVIARADGWTVRIVHSSSGSENANAVDVANVCLRHIQQAEYDAQTLTNKGFYDIPASNLALHKGYYGQNENERTFAPENHIKQGSNDQITPKTVENTKEVAQPNTHMGLRGEHTFAQGGGGSAQPLPVGGLPHIVTVKVDAIGLGWGVVGLLEMWGRDGLHNARIVGVNVAERALDAGKFKNQRAEMWWNGRQLLQPDQDGFQVVCLDVDRRVVGQLGLPDFVSDSSGRIQVVSKAVLKKRGGVSPDRAEAVLLALYEPDRRREVPLVAPIAIVQRNVWSM
jgi:hypothetical protein